jgi:hypothetical protein
VAVKAGGGSAILSPDGSFTGAKPDAAIVVSAKIPMLNSKAIKPMSRCTLRTSRASRCCIGCAHPACLRSLCCCLAGRPISPADQRSGCLCRGLATWVGGRGRSGCADRPPGRCSEPRLRRAPVLLLAQAPGPNAAQHGYGRLRPAVRIWIRAQLRRPPPGWHAARTGSRGRERGTGRLPEG